MSPHEIDTKKRDQVERAPPLSLALWSMTTICHKMGHMGDEAFIEASDKRWLRPRRLFDTYSTMRGTIRGLIGIL